MDYRKTFLYLSMICALASCRRSEPVLYVELEYINNSVHEISVDLSEGPTEYDTYLLTLSPGSTATVKYGGWESNVPELLLPPSAEVRYDKDILIRHNSKDDKNTYHNICHPENYTIKRLDKCPEEPVYRTKALTLSLYPLETGSTAPHFTETLSGTTSVTASRRTR